MIGTEKRENLAADAPAETAVKREVPRAGLLVVSLGNSFEQSDGEITEVSRLANAPA